MLITIVIIVVAVIIALDVAAIFVVRRSGRMEEMAFAEVTSRVGPGERVLFKGSVSKMLLGVWPYIPVSGALLVTNLRILWKQGEGVPVPFLLRTSLDISVPSVEDVSNPGKVNPDMVQMTVDGKTLRFFMNALAGPKFSKDNQRKPGELTAAIHEAMAAARSAARAATA